MNRSRVNNLFGVMMIVTAAVSWGLSTVVFIPNLYNLPTAFVVLLQNLFALVLISLICPKEYAKTFKYTPMIIFLLSMIALFSGVIGTLAIVKALFLVHFKQLSIVILIQKVQPIFTVIFAVIFLKEKLSKNFIFWSIVVLCGVYLITFGFKLPEHGTNDDQLLAYLLSVISALSFSSNTIIGRYMANCVSFQSITFSRFFFGTIFSIIVCLFTGTLFFFSSVTANNYIFIIAIALTAGPPSMFIYYLGLRYVKAMVSGICELALPFSVIILDYLINGSSLTIVQWAGAIIIIFGILKISRFSLSNPKTGAKEKIVE